MVAADITSAGDEFSVADEKLIELLAGGSSYRATAGAGGVSYSTILRRMRKPVFRNEVRRRTRIHFEHPARVAASERHWIYQQFKRLAQTAEDESVQLAALRAMDQIACDGITLSLADTLLDMQAGEV
tara:strand:+ start:2997 stop:3380 length:384 start_codon:yes stop_codon:yes gene_type:complete